MDALMGKDFFDAIVDENAWELAGEGVRKFDLIRWNLLRRKNRRIQKRIYKMQCIMVHIHSM